METIQFEAIKIAMKQDKEGYVLTLRVHPDEVPDALFRDFVGARYQAVMVRIGESGEPMNRESDLSRDLVRLAGILCRDRDFADWLQEQGEILEASEPEVVDWMRNHLGVQSRSEIPHNPDAIKKLQTLNHEFRLWKQSA